MPGRRASIIVVLDFRFLLKLPNPDPTKARSSMRDSTEKEFCMPMDGIEKLVAVGKEKGYSGGQRDE